MPPISDHFPGLRLWTGLALAAGATAAAAGPIVPIISPPMPQALIWQVQGEGEGGSESAYVDDDVAYLAGLDFVLGHLTVGTALYAEGQVDMALTHMKHPKDEIYSDLIPAFAARNQPGFAEELAAIAAAVEAGAPAADVQAALGVLTAALNAARGTPDARTEMDSVVALVRIAADEYSIGVVDGALANLHEYQDSWGFVQVAMARLTGLEGSADPAVAAAATKALVGTTPR